MGRQVLPSYEFQCQTCNPYPILRLIFIIFTIITVIFIITMHCMTIGSGHVDAEELRRVLTECGRMKLTEEEANEFIGGHQQNFLVFSKFPGVFLRFLSTFSEYFSQNLVRTFSLKSSLVFFFSNLPEYFFNCLVFSPEYFGLFEPLEYFFESGTKKGREPGSHFFPTMHPSDFIVLTNRNG